MTPASHTKLGYDPLPSILNTHPVPTIVLDSDGTVAGMNHAAELLLNRSSASLYGVAASHYFEWLNDIGIDALLAEPSKTVSAYAVDLMPSRSGKQFADISIGQASSVTGQRMLCIHAIPSAERVILRRHGSAARAASAAAAILAHEIKNPLSGIKGAAQLLGKAAQGANTASLSGLIVGEVDRIAKLIDSMQDFTRDASLSCAAINIYPALAQARDIAAQGFAKGYTIDEEFDPSLPSVLANHDALVQILLNLMKNGAEAAANSASPVLRLVTAYRHGLSWNNGDMRGSTALPVEIAIGDNGPGIDDAMSDVLFDPFVTSKADGQGLGLALVEKLIKDIGGFVQHERSDGWTWFRVHLSLADHGPMLRPI